MTLCLYPKEGLNILLWITSTFSWRHCSSDTLGGTHLTNALHGFPLFSSCSFFFSFLLQWWYSTMLLKDGKNHIPEMFEYASTGVPKKVTVLEAAHNVFYDRLFKFTGVVPDITRFCHMTLFFISLSCILSKKMLTFKKLYKLYEYMPTLVVFCIRWLKWYDDIL